MDLSIPHTTNTCIYQVSETRDFLLHSDLLSRDVVPRFDGIAVQHDDDLVPSSLFLVVLRKQAEEEELRAPPRHCQLCAAPKLSPVLCLI
jgi:hypothetical protein